MKETIIIPPRGRKSPIQGLRPKRRNPVIRAEFNINNSSVKIVQHLEPLTMLRLAIPKANSGP
jgi:hypothetical protein